MKDFRKFIPYGYKLLHVSVVKYDTPFIDANVYFPDKLPENLVGTHYLISVYPRSESPDMYNTLQVYIPVQAVSGFERGDSRGSVYNRGNATRARNTYKGRTSRRYSWYNN